MTKPISEFTDAELRVFAQGARNARADDLAAEVLALRQKLCEYLGQSHLCPAVEVAEHVAAELAEARTWMNLATKWAVDPAGIVQRAEAAAARAEMVQWQEMYFAKKAEYEVMRVDSLSARQELARQRPVLDAALALRGDELMRQELHPRFRSPEEFLHVSGLHTALAAAVDAYRDGGQA
jgi:hypothetical protein